MGWGLALEVWNLGREDQGLPGHWLTCAADGRRFGRYKSPTCELLQPSVSCAAAAVCRFAVCLSIFLYVSLPVLLWVLLLLLVLRSLGASGHNCVSSAYILTSVSVVCVCRRLSACPFVCFSCPFDSACMSQLSVSLSLRLPFPPPQQLQLQGPKAP